MEIFFNLNPVAINSKLLGNSLKNLAFLLYIFTISVFIDSCGTTDIQVTNNKPIVKSISPAIGWSGDIITISGGNFGVWGKDLLVVFDDSVYIKPNYITDSTIQIIIPSKVIERVYRVVLTNRTDSVIVGNLTTSSKMLISSIQPTKVWRADVVTITGKRFGTKGSDITIFLDQIPINTSFISDTQIEFEVPQTVTQKEYTLTVRKLNETIIPEQKITMVQGLFSFQTAIVSVQSDGYFSRYGKGKGYDTSYTGSWAHGISVTGCNSISDCFHSLPKQTFAITCCYNRGNPFETSGRYCYAMADTNAHVISSLSCSDYSSYNSPYNAIRDIRSSSFGLSLKNAVYKEIEGGIEIFYKGQALKDIALSVSYSESSTYSTAGVPERSSSEKYSQSGQYSDDDYVRIILKR